MKIVIPIWLLVTIVMFGSPLVTWFIVKIGGQWWTLKPKKFLLDKKGFIYPLYFTLILYAVAAFLDLINWYSKQSFIGEVASNGIIDSGQTLVLFLTLLAIVAYTVETYRLRDITYEATNEAIKANELRLRPYLSLHWNSSFKSSGRRGEQMTDSCLLARNDGAGLMKRVSYKVKVDGKDIFVRNHNIITSGKGGTSVVYALNNKKALLGDRNDKSKVVGNNELISEGMDSCVISGEYEDINSTKYEYSFVRDTNEQSWFKEVYQRRKKVT